MPQFVVVVPDRLIYYNGKGFKLLKAEFPAGIHGIEIKDYDPATDTGKGYVEFMDRSKPNEEIDGLKGYVGLYRAFKAKEDEVAAKKAAKLKSLAYRLDQVDSLERTNVYNVADLYSQVAAISQVLAAIGDIADAFFAKFDDKVENYLTAEQLTRLDEIKTAYTAIKAHRANAESLKDEAKATPPGQLDKFNPNKGWGQ